MIRPAVLAFAGALVLVGCGASNQFSGSVTLTSDDLGKRGDECFGQGGYSDLRGGARVVVADGDGKVLATGSLEPGVQPSASTCRFPFEIGSVPPAPFYGIEVGSRSPITFSDAELKGTGYYLGLTIGS